VVDDALNEIGAFISKAWNVLEEWNPEALTQLHCVIPQNSGILRNNSVRILNLAL
jgi:hypothetical protein